MSKASLFAFYAAVAVTAVAKDAPKSPADLDAHVHAYDHAQIHGDKPALEQAELIDDYVNAPPSTWSGRKRDRPIDKSGRRPLMTLKTIERPVQILVGLQIRTKPMSPEIPAHWPKFVARIDEIPNPAEPRVSYGVMRFDAGNLEYAAAISVTRADRVPAGMSVITLPAGIYAAFSYPLSGLGQGFREIHERLVPASNYQQAPGNFFERYDEKFDPTNPQSAVGIFIPLRPKA